jgi:hypothetical protein
MVGCSEIIRYRCSFLDCLVNFSFQNLVYNSVHPARLMQSALLASPHAPLWTLADLVCAREQGSPLPQAFAFQFVAPEVCLVLF